MENEEIEDVFTDDENYQEDTTDWKAKFEAEEGRRRRAETALEKAKRSTSEKQTDKAEKSEGLDRLDLAILRVEKITGEDEVSLVESIMKDTGKSLEQVLASKYFQAELKEMRETKATEEATPNTTKRSNTSTRDSVDYWLAKGELPTDPTLRSKVVKAKIDRAKATSQFSDNPIG
jgi:uncharacterized membrane protein YgaE (UPF0421/DUF939 family)